MIDRHEKDLATPNALAYFVPAASEEKSFFLFDRRKKFVEKQIINWK
jgi:hypothetical protein